MKKIGIKLADGQFYPILDEGTPKKRMLDLTTVKDNQTKVQVDLYRSELGTMEDAEYVDTLEVTNLTPHPNGEPELHLSVGLDENNELSAEVIDSETGEKSEIQVQLVNRTLAERDASPADFSLSEANNSTDDTFGFDSFELPSDENTETVITDEPAAEPQETAEEIEVKDPTDLDPIIPEQISADDVPFSFDTVDLDSITEEPASEPAVTEEPDVVDPEEPVMGETAISEEELSLDSILDSVEETPAEETPATEEPVLDEPAADSVMEETAFEESVFEEPATEEPVLDSTDFEDISIPVPEETVTEEPAAETETAAEEPASFDDFNLDTLTEDTASTTDEPVIEDIPSEETVVEEEITFDEPAVEESSFEEPAVEEVTMDEPAPQEEAAAEDSILTETFSFDDIPVEDYEAPAEETVSTDETISAEEPSFEDIPSEEPVAEEEITFDEPAVEESSFEGPAVEETEITDTAFDEPAIGETTFDEPAADNFATDDITVTDDFGSADESLDLPDFGDLDTDFTSSTEQETQNDFSDVDFSTDDVSSDSTFTEEEFSIPDFGDTSDTFTTETTGLSGVFDDPTFDEDPVFTDDDLSSSSSGGMDFSDLYDDETLAGEHATPYDDDDEEDDGKRRTSVIICIICAIICLIATALVLFVIPSKYNLLNKGNTETSQEIEQPAEKELPPPPPVVEDPVEENVVVAPEAQEDKIIVATEEESAVTVPVSTPSPSGSKEDIRYKIKWGDTLWDISETFYKTPWKFKNIADYNKIKNPDRIISGTYINIASEN